MLSLSKEKQYHILESWSKDGLHNMEDQVKSENAGLVLKKH